MLEKVKTVIGQIFKWAVALIWFIILQPIIWVVQGLIFTPIEMIYLCIKNKRVIEPVEYWKLFSNNIAIVYYFLYELVE